MATPIIQINNGGTGSDTAASGAGPTTALTGTAASTSGTGPVVTLDGSPSLAGVLTDGSHVIWINTASGRQFAAITAKDDTAKTVTTTTAFTVSLTGQTWAIGGKRATLDNANTRKLFSADAATGWLADVQEAGTAYTISTTTLNVGIVGFGIISSTTSRPTITTSTSSMRLITYTAACNGMLLKHLNFSTTATTRSSCLFPLGAVANGHLISDCVFDGFATAIDGTNGAGNFFDDLVLDACEFKNGTIAISNLGNAQSVTTMTDCFVHDHSATALGGTVSLNATGCVFARNDRVLNAASTMLSLVRCDVQGSTNVASPAIAVTGGTFTAVELIGNVFYGNLSTFAVTLFTVVNLIQRSNAYGGNAANRSGFAAGTGDVTLTADPFTLAASNNFTLNSAAGGGALCKGVLNNVVAPGLIGTAAGDLGAFQSATSGSSGGLRTIGLNGGF
jgi:hypothetical protein